MKFNNKVLNLITKTVTILLVLFTVFIMVFTIISKFTFDQNDRGIFGLKLYIVKTDSMSPSENNKDMDVHFSAGDIVIIKQIKDKTALKSGDIIAFISSNPDDSYGQTITHMIREPRYNSKGQLLGYVTFGTNTGADDEKLVTPEFIIGQYTGKLPKVGHFFAFVKTTPGYICCILIPFLLLIMVNAVDVIRLFRRYKKEQNAAIDAEKAEIAAERARNEEMLRELLALKEQLAGGAPPATTVPVTVAPAAEEPVAVAQPEPKPEPIPEPKPEPKSEPKPEPKSEPAEQKPASEDDEAARKKAEAARKRRETLARKKAEAEAEAARLAAEEEAARLAEEEAARKKAEAARKRKETIARKKAEAEAARLAAENAASDNSGSTEDSSSEI